MRKTTSPRLNLTWWTSSMLGVTVPPSHRSAKWPTYLRVRFHVFIFCRISYIQGGKFSLSKEKSTNLCGCKSYLFQVNNYMSSTNVLSVSGDRYMNKRYPKWILSPYQRNESSVCVREDVGQCRFNFVLFLGYTLCTSTLLYREL